MSTLEFPPGRIPGCLYRLSRPGGLCSLWGEKMEVIPVGEWDDLIGTVEVSSLVPVIFDQGKNGSCATESSTQGVQISRAFSGVQFVQLNPLFVYHHTNGGRDAGSSIDENLDFIRARGVAPESVWPRSKGWAQKPTADAYAAAADYRILEWWDCSTIAEIGSAVLRGFPVVMGWKGHSVVLTELISKSEALYCNSWGKAWGASGFGRIRLADINFAYGAFAVRAVL